MLRTKWIRHLSVGAISAIIAVVIPLSSQAEDPIHFGSIFSQDNNFRSEETKNNLNKITEKTDQQENLEELYPEIKEQNQRMRQIQGTPSAQALPAYQNDGSRVGVVTNNELQRHVIYFIELRPIQGNTPKNLHLQPNTLTRPMARIEPGEMVKVVDSEQEYILKMRMDRDNQGLWKQVARKRESDPSDMYVYYDWKNFDTVSSSQSALELDIMVPRDMSSVPVFTKPGAWTWKDCQLGSDICVDRIDQHVEAFLLDTGFALVNDMRSRQSVMQLFYKIGYKTYDKEGKLRQKIGWIPSFFARRKIASLPKNLLSTNEYGFSGFETDEERMQRLSKHYIFTENMFSSNRLSSRWLQVTPGQKNEIFDNTFDYEAIISYNGFELEQSFLNEPFKQTGVALGLGLYIPLYVDLEVQGTFTYTVPIAQEPADVYPKTSLFRGDQWLMYTTPIGVNDMPLKVGIGMYYLTMFESQTNFGFKSFVGFQSKLAIENDRFWFDVRFGPTGQDFSFDMSNRELGASLGIRLDPSQSYDSLTLFFDYSQTNYTSPVSGHTTDFNLLNVGFKKSF